MISMDWDIRVGDALELLQQMPAESVQCCITSPPYFGLRDYGTGMWEGGDASCDHMKGELRRGINLAASAHSTRGGAKKAATVENISYGATCGKCGATRIDQQVGLETTPDAYVERIVVIFREVRRVLRDDGTLWLNIGDSYASGATPQGAKPKDLLGIPWMLAFALRADGWYLRSEIIWAKPNPMPESVNDRPTKAHEQLFLFAKSKSYFYDAQAIRTEDKGTDHRRTPSGAEPSLEPSNGLAGPHSGIRSPDGRNGRGANKRSVWMVATKPYPKAHFATFPAKLIEPCVLAGSPAGGVVLDPFAGAGTTGLVALEHGRTFVGIELNPEYADLANARIAAWLVKFLVAA